MLAYKCDICGKFVEGKPTGVLYDKSYVTDDNRGKRFDLCPNCVSNMSFSEPDCAEENVKEG